MHVSLLASAILCVLMALTHSILGERLILGPLAHTTDLPVVRGSQTATRRTLRFTWHITSIFGLGIAAVLFYFAQLEMLDSSQIFVIRALSLTFFLCFLVAVIGSRGRHLSWLIFMLLWILTGFAI